MSIILATLQLLSTWAGTLATFDETVNSEIHKLENSIDSSHQQLDIKDIKIEICGYYYYAFILYDVIEKTQKEDHSIYPQ